MEAIKLSVEEMQLIETFHQVHPEVPSAFAYSTGSVRSYRKPICRWKRMQGS